MQGLGPTASIKAVYDRPFGLGYVVTLWEHELGTELHVTSSDELEFQALLHNYIRAPADQVLVRPLANKRYYDKTEESGGAKTETRVGVDVRRVTDSVYEAVGDEYEVRWPGGGVGIKVGGFKDVVVWNPQELGSKMADMEDGGWWVLCAMFWVVFTLFAGPSTCALSRGMLSATRGCTLTRRGLGDKFCRSNKRVVPGYTSTFTAPFFFFSLLYVVE